MRLGRWPPPSASASRSRCRRSGRRSLSFRPSTASGPRGSPLPKFPRPSYPPSVNPPRSRGCIHYFRVERAFRTDPHHNLRRWWRFASAAAGVAFCRNSRRNAFGARSVATVIVTGGRPSAWWRRKASVRRRSFFQHSRNQVPTARCTQNSSSYSSFSRSWNGLSSSPARTKRWSEYVDARRRQMFFARVHRRTSRNREAFAYTIPAIGPEARLSLNPHPVAVSTQRSASFHEPSSRTFSYRPRRRIPSDFLFEGGAGPDRAGESVHFRGTQCRVALRECREDPAHRRDAQTEDRHRRTDIRLEIRRSRRLRRVSKFLDELIPRGADVEHHRFGRNRDGP